MKFTLTAFVGAAALALALPAAAVTAPRVAITSLDQLARPLPLPYDTKADADAQVAAAMARARTGHKLLLIDFGGNWCLDCRVLAGVVAVPEIRAFVDAHYEIVTVDIGRRDKNLGVAKAYGLDVAGVPAILIVDPVTNKLRNPGEFAALADARSMTPQALADWLAKWV